MERKIFLFITDDKEYAEALAVCMRSLKIAADFTIINPEEADRLKEKKSNLKGYDVVITDLEDCSISGENIFYLITEDEAFDDNKAYKYWGISQITEKLSAFIGSANIKRQNFEHGKRKCPIYIISSGAGGTGASSIAMGIARDFAGAGGEKILYLSVCDIHKERSFFEQKAKGNIKEYIYELLYGRQPFYEHFGAFFNRDIYGVSSFNTMTFENQLMQLSEAEMKSFILSIANAEKFDRVIIDAGNSRKVQAQVAKEYADCIIYIIDNNKDVISYEILEEEKNRYDKVLTVENLVPPVSEKFREFLEDDTDDEIKEGEDAEGTEKKSDVSIFEDKKAFSVIDGIIDIDMSGDFGKDIRNLISYIASSFCL